MTIVIPGKLENPLNGSHGHWSKHARWARTRKAKAEMCILAALKSRQPPWPPEAPKRITFLATVWNQFDSDGLSAACKPIRDSLQSMGLINSDAPGAGHTFLYEQRIERGKRAAPGVTVQVELVR